MPGTTPHSTLPEEPQTSSQSTESTSNKSATIGSRKARESTREKGERLLTQGRLLVTKVDGSVVRAECRGDTGRVYQLGHDFGGNWTCSCPARTACSHLIALWLVAIVK